MNLRAHIERAAEQLVDGRLQGPILALAAIPALALLPVFAFQSLATGLPPRSGALEFTLNGLSGSTSTSDDGKTDAAARDGAEGAVQSEEYVARAIARIDRFKRYPRREHEEQIEGSVLLEVRVGSTGAVESISVLRGSEHSGFNREAVAAVERAAPLPPPAKPLAFRVELRFAFR